MAEITITLPSGWSEIFEADKAFSPDEFLHRSYYLQLIKILQADFSTEAEARMAAIQIFNNIDAVEIGKQLGAANTSQRNAIANTLLASGFTAVIDEAFPALDFIFNNEPFYVNPVTQFTLNGITFYGPTSGKLSDQTGEEWIISHHAQTLYNDTQEEQHLCNIIAANYHRVSNGTRLPFSEKTLAADAAVIAQAPIELLHGIYLWYIHADSWWFNKFSHLFDSDEEQTEKADGLEVRNLLFEMAGSKLDASWDILKARSRQDIFYALDRINAKRIEQEKYAAEKD